MKLCLGLFLLGLLSVTLAEEYKGCRKNDVVFLIDSSGSQSPSQFRKQIAFVQGVVRWFPIGTSDVLVSVITFSLDVTEEFPLNKYPTKTALVKAIGKVTYHGLLTNTSGALRHARLKSFLPQNGGRPNVDKIVIVLTDGVSNEPDETIREAELLRKSYNVKVYAVVIGERSSKKEILSITGTKDHIQNVGSFDSLSEVSYMFQRRVCRIDGGWNHWTEWSPCTAACGPGKRIRTRNCDNPIPEKGGKFCEGSPTQERKCYLKKCFVCGDYPIDVFFFLDASISVFPWRFSKELAFVHEFVYKSVIGWNNLRVGLAVYSSKIYEEFKLNTYYRKSDMLAHINKVKYNWGYTHTWNALDYARTKAFLFRNGGRSNATQVIILMSDGGSSNVKVTAKAAYLLRKNKNIQVYVIGIGTGLNYPEMHQIASQPENVIHSDGFSGLKDIEEKVRHTVVILLASGSSSNARKTARAAYFLKRRKNTQVYVIGIGSNTEMQTVASRPGNFISSDGFSRLKDIEAKVRHTVCPEYPHH